MGTYINDCLSRKILFFTGKGGVGKSTLAWATALALKRHGKKVAVASWDPFEIHTGAVASIKLDTMGCFREFVIKTIRFEKFYDLVFDNYVLKTFVTTAPGVSDTVIAGKLAFLVEQGEYDVVLVDLPSSGHTLSFFRSPFGVQTIFPIGYVNREAKKIGELFQSATARIDFVLLPEELSITETTELYQGLKSLGLSTGFALVNQVTPEFKLPSEVPATLEAPVTLYRETREREAEAISGARALGLTTLELPRLPTESMETAIEQLAEELERR